MVKENVSLIKKKKRHGKIVLLAKTNVDTMADTNVDISKALINSYIYHNNFFSVNNVPWEYNDERRNKKS